MCDVTEAVASVHQVSELNELVRTENLIPLAAIVIGGMIGIVAIISSALKSIFVGRAREATRRELAAYVAEGTLDPDKAIAMLRAEGEGCDGSCGEET